MGRKVKYSAKEKNAVREYLDGKESMSSIAKRLEIAFQSLKQWVKNYEAMGTDAFSTCQNKRYSKTEKDQAVAAYFTGEGSLSFISFSNLFCFIYSIVVPKIHCWQMSIAYNLLSTSR